jgi:hypothetical protein
MLCFPLMSRLVLVSRFLNLIIGSTVSPGKLLRNFLFQRLESLNMLKYQILRESQLARMEYEMHTEKRLRDGEAGEKIEQQLADT